jgi:hypothetical protein
METEDVGKSRSKISISEIVWATTRIILLVILQFGLDMTYKVGWFEFFGPQEIQRLVFDILKSCC